MRTNKIKELWGQGKAPAVAWLSTADTYVAELMGNMGFDALVLDMQHGMVATFVFPSLDPFLHGN